MVKCSVKEYSYVILFLIPTIVLIFYCTFIYIYYYYYDYVLKSYIFTINDSEALRKRIKLLMY